MGKEDKTANGSQGTESSGGTDRYSRLYQEYQAVRSEQNPFHYDTDRRDPNKVRDVFRRMNTVIDAARTGLQEFPDDGFFISIFANQVIQRAVYVLSLLRSRLWPDQVLSAQVASAMIEDLQLAIRVLDDEQNNSESVDNTSKIEDLRTKIEQIRASVTQ